MPGGGGEEGGEEGGGGGGEEGGGGEMGHIYNSPPEGLTSSLK